MGQLMSVRKIWQLVLLACIGSLRSIHQGYYPLGACGRGALLVSIKTMQKHSFGWAGVGGLVPVTGSVYSMLYITTPDTG